MRRTTNDQGIESTHQLPTRWVAGMPLAAFVVLFVFANLSPMFLTFGHAAPNETTRVSVSSSGEQGNGQSAPLFLPFHTSISADGRVVLFQSWASNLVPGDANGLPDLFLHDRHTDSTSRVTDSSNEQQLWWSNSESMSSDGRYIVYSSGPNPFQYPIRCIFIYDRQTGGTSQLQLDGLDGGNDFVLIHPHSSPGRFDNLLLHPTISADGRYVAFEAVIRIDPSFPIHSASRVYVHDRQTGSTTLVSGNSTFQTGVGFSENPSLSADGRYVAFRSNEPNLVAGDINSTYDVFVYDQQTGETSRVSVSSSGEQAALPSFGVSISADGRYVAFSSAASNLVAGDTNNATDVFVHDRQTGITSRVSLSSNGNEGSGTNPSISADGRFVMFESESTNLVAEDTNNSVDVFVHDRQTGNTSRVSVSSSGDEGDDGSEGSLSSANGRYVAFQSDATNLVPGDTNGFDDVFVHERGGPISSPQSLTVTRSGDGSGTVTSHVAGIACGADCSEDYLSGSLVTLTATPTVGSVFTGWTGSADWSGTSCSGTGTCTVLMTQAHTVTAIFTPLGGGGNSISARYVRLVVDSEVNGNPWTSIAELTVLDENGTPLDQSGWMLQSVDSEELVGENGAGENAFDGNPATIWHTQWSGVPGPPHEIIIDLGAVQAMSGFRYLPRQDGGVNGRIADYRFYGSSDGVMWGASLATGTFANSAEQQQVAFGGTRYVRLVADSEVNGNPWTSLAELTVLDGNGAPLDQSSWSLQSVDSQEVVGENGAAVNAFDGNPATFWHTQWSGGSTPHPHEIVIDLGYVQTVSGFGYLPRQDGGVNGRIVGYQFYGGLNGVSWGAPLAIGTFVNTADEQQVVFGGTRYVRLVASSEVNGNTWSSMAELTLLDETGAPIDKSGWTLQSVDSEELVGENGAAVNAFDGNIATIWHTQWSGESPPHPHEIIIDLGIAQVIGGFRYLPRQDGGVNGRIAEYQFYGGTDGVTWGVPLVSGAFADTDQEQEVLF